MMDRRSFLAAGLAGTALATSGELHARAPRVKTKFAINAEIWWGKLKFLERIRKAKEHGFPAIEFWPYQGKDIGAIASLTKELGIEVAQFTGWGFEPGMNNPANEEKFVAQIEEACGVAKKLSCRKMTVVAGNNQKGMTQDEMLKQVTKALRRAAPIAEKHEVMLILEPMNGRVDHPGHCLYGSVDAVKICREVGSKFVKINWDLYHMQLSEGDLCGRLKDGIDQLGYAQIADTPGRHEPGTGEVRWNRVLKQLCALGYRDYVGLELWPTTEDAGLKAVAAADVWEE